MEFSVLERPVGEMLFDETPLEWQDRQRILNHVKSVRRKHRVARKNFGSSNPERGISHINRRASDDAPERQAVAAAARVLKGQQKSVDLIAQATKALQRFLPDEQGHGDACECGGECQTCRGNECTRLSDDLSAIDGTIDVIRIMQSTSKGIAALTKALANMTGDHVQDDDADGELDERYQNAMGERLRICNQLSRFCNGSAACQRC